MYQLVNVIALFFNDLETFLNIFHLSGVTGSMENLMDETQEKLSSLFGKTEEKVEDIEKKLEDKTNEVKNSTSIVPE